MAEVFPGRYTADAGDECVVILVGMRVNRPWKLHRWLWFSFQARAMTRWLQRRPQEGLLWAGWGWVGGSAMGIQYWRSFDDLERFAADSDAPHLRAWRRYHRQIGSSGDLGLWHEVYRLRRGSYEAAYMNMPRWGLAAATRHLPIGAGAETARQRLGEPEPPRPAN